MKIRALEIRLHDRVVGLLYQLATAAGGQSIRFVADDRYIQRGFDEPVLSLGFKAGDRARHAAFWSNARRVEFQGQQDRDGSALLPPFFQNLLPEGVFRNHLADIRGCAPNDHFELLAACGSDLPGALKALPVTMTPEMLQRAALPHDDDPETIEPVQWPVEEAVSLSGIQPKLAAAVSNGRYVARTRDRDAHIIAKLPAPQFPHMPEAEYLALCLARAAGVDVCEAQLVPLHLLDGQRAYAAPELYAGHSTFLAVRRFDRDAHGAPQGRLHCEDFAQILGVYPSAKYQGSYETVASVLLSMPSLGQRSVLELLARILVNELLGNPDMHLKNIGVLYSDPSGAPALSPAYDIVPYSIFNNVRGHALRFFEQPPGEWLSGFQGRKPWLNESTLSLLADRLELPERPIRSHLKRVLQRARLHWPNLIESSVLLPPQKARLLSYFKSHPMMVSGV